MAYTEFCCRSGGSNLNAGTRTGNTTEPGTAAFKTYTSGTWVQATRTFTPAGGANPTNDGIAVGDFVSIYPDAATVTPYVARITTVGSTTFVTSATAFSGTAPVDGALVTSASIGGAWKGPNAAESFPFGFVTSALTNATPSPQRVNFKNDAQYNITAAMTHSINGFTRFEGYTTAYGDGGRAIIDGGTSGASYILLTLSSSTGGRYLKYLTFQNNGATGSASGISTSAGQSDSLESIVVNSVRGKGFAVGGTGTYLMECEAYSCNQSNTTNLAGIHVTSGTPILLRCISHDNSAGSNCHGFIIEQSTQVKFCIADTNAGVGFKILDFYGSDLQNCDAYNNSSDGVTVATSSGFGYYFNIQNCNFVKNGGWGINITGTGNKVGTLYNNAFGTGTQANTSGTVTGAGALESIGAVNYASNITPWIDPANGDFRINLAAAINAGRGTFTETQASYAGTIGYPDIGAAQHLESAGAAGMLFIPDMAGM